MGELPSELTRIEIIRQNQRFSSSKAQFNDEMVFVKQVNDPELATNLHREVYGLEVFNNIARSHELSFEVPRLLLHGDDYIVTSWANG